MVKQRTALIPIAKLSERRSTYKKRRECLLKKTEELSVLCGVQACIVMYGPDSREPDMWPPQEETLSILSRFNNLPEEVKNKNMLNQDTILSKQVKKLQVDLRKAEEENAHLEKMILLHDVLSGQCGLADVAGAGGMLALSGAVEARLNEVRKRVDELHSLPQTVGPLEEVLLHDVLSGQCGLADVAGAGGMLALSGAVEARLNEVCKRVDEMLCVPQPVGPLEEVLLQGQFRSGAAGTGVVPQEQEQHFPVLDFADMAPPAKKQCIFGLGNDDMQQLCLPNWYPDGGSREEGNVPESADVAAIPLGPEAEDDIAQFFDWSGFEEIFSVN